MISEDQKIIDQEELHETAGYHFDSHKNGGAKEIFIMLGIVVVIAVLIGIGIGIFSVMNEAKSQYRFGANTETYKELKQNTKFNPLFTENARKYVWKSEFVIDSTKDTLRIEHLLRATDKDAEFFPHIESKDFLLTRFTLDSATVLTISVKQNIGGTELKQLQTYVVRDTSANKSKKMKALPLESGKRINDQAPFSTLLFASPFPQGVEEGNFGSEKEMFKTVDQEITIVYLDNNGKEQTHKIALELEWYRFKSWYEQIVYDEVE